MHTRYKDLNKSQKNRRYRAYIFGYNKSCRIYRGLFLIILHIKLLFCKFINDTKKAATTPTSSSSSSSSDIKHTYSDLLTTSMTWIYREVCAL